MANRGHLVLLDAGDVEAGAVGGVEQTGGFNPIRCLGSTSSPNGYAQGTSPNAYAAMEPRVACNP